MASLKCIASELGVSYSLVSKVLSGKLGTTGVSLKTRQAIVRKAKQLDYVPNRLAVALKAGRKGAVGIFLHHIGSPGSDVSDRLIRGMADALEQSGARMWLRFFTTDEEFLSACDTRLKQEVDGLIVAGLHHPGLMKKFRDLERQNVPVVCLFNDLPDQARKALTNVEVDYEKQGYLATKHLLEQGCRKVACFRTVENRTAGYLRAHWEMGLKADPKLLIPAENFYLSSGRSCLIKLLDSGKPFDGIVCQSDSQAIGAINELMRRQIAVPDAVKVTGVDNSPLAAGSVVPITSVSSGMRSAGQRAVETLLEKIEGRPVSPVVIEPHLYPRASSGAARAEAEDALGLE
jgi:LacI family transcriptional regulator